MQLPPDRVTVIQTQWTRERPEIDTSPMSTIARIHRLALILSDELNALYARYGLTEGEFDVLAALRRAGDPFELAAGELADHTMVTTGAVSKRLDRLEAAGYVTRRRSSSDGRSRMVRLTPVGRAHFDEVFTAHMENERRLLADVPPDDAARLTQILHAWLLHYES